MCSCSRCRDPTEFGSYLSALVCEKCDLKKCSAILPHDPLDQDSYWHCTNVHKSTKIESNLAQQLAIGKKNAFKKVGLITSTYKIRKKNKNFLAKNPDPDYLNCFALFPVRLTDGFVFWRSYYNNQKFGNKNPRIGTFLTFESWIAIGCQTISGSLLQPSP